MVSQMYLDKMYINYWDDLPLRPRTVKPVPQNESPKKQDSSLSKVELS